MRGSRGQSRSRYRTAYRRAGRFSGPRHRRALGRRYRGRLAAENRHGRRRSRPRDRRSRRHRYRRKRLAKPLANPHRRLRHRHRAVRRRLRTRQERVKSPGAVQILSARLGLVENRPCRGAGSGLANYNQELSLLAGLAESTASLHPGTRIGCTTDPAPGRRGAPPRCEE